MKFSILNYVECLKSFILGYEIVQIRNLLLIVLNHKAVLFFISVSDQEPDPDLDGSGFFRRSGSGSGL